MADLPLTVVPGVLGPVEMPDICGCVPRSGLWIDVYVFPRRGVGEGFSVSPAGGESGCLGVSWEKPTVTVP